MDFIVWHAVINTDLVEEQFQQDTFDGVKRHGTFD